MIFNKRLLLISGVVFLAAACTRITPPVQQPESASTKQNTEQSTTTVGKETDSDGGTETPESEAREKAEYEKAHPNEKEEKISLGSYKDYSAETVAAEQKEGRKVVLFFHAKWCPDCRALNSSFLAHPDVIPEGVTVLKLDYDTQTTLKEKYGVVSQHTFVQIDNNGNMVAKWNIVDADLIANYIK